MQEAEVNHEQSPVDEHEIERENIPDSGINYLDIMLRGIPSIG